jgi:hypothetical protein
MRKLHKFAVIGLGVIAGSVAGEPPSSALEPVDNNAPFMAHANTTLLGCPTQNCSWVSAESISTSTDVDYLLITCGFLDWKLQHAQIDFTGSSGDLDMQVYQLDGTLVGGSYGVGNTEYVDTSAMTSNGLVLKVYGYHGAKNTYTISVLCS